MVIGKLTTVALVLASACSNAAGAFVPEAAADVRGLAAVAKTSSVASLRSALRLGSKHLPVSRQGLIPFNLAQTTAAYPQCDSSTLATLEAASACWECRNDQSCTTSTCPLFQPEGMSNDQAFLCPVGECCVRGILDSAGLINAAVIDGLLVAENGEGVFNFDQCPPCVAPQVGLECTSFTVPDPNAALGAEVECASGSSEGSSGVFISSDGTVSESKDEDTQAPTVTNDTTRAPATTTAASAAPSTEQATEDSSTTTTKSTDDSGTCFPADASVELEHGRVVRMDALAIGDSVKVGANKFSKVFMFTHKMADVSVEFVVIHTASGASLSLTSGHYIYAGDGLVAAGTVAVGDELILGHGRRSAVTSVSHASGRGLYNPQTLSGDIVVNGIVASTYTTAVDPGLAHLLLAPLRALSRLGLRCTGLESGGGRLTGYAPGGVSTIV